jgi:hypothetical protein
MNEHDSNNELHPIVPSEFNGGIFLVLVQNNETHEVYTGQLKAFTTESGAEYYASTFTQHWITARIILLPINEVIVKKI